MNFIAKSSGLSPYFKATSQAVASQIRPLATPVVVHEKSELILPPSENHHNSYSLAKALPTGRILAKAGGIGTYGVTSQIRCAHTDIKVPNFDYYRSSATQDPTKPARDTEDNRKVSNYLVLTAGLVGSTLAAKSLVTTFVSSMAPSADVLAMAKIEINLADIPEGKNATFKWRGKPLFIRHRPAAEVEREAAVDISTLRDPQPDSDRAKVPEWLIVIGVCTHLGCVPIANAGDFGGYYCPCHGSHYDAAGRIRKGPAPLNLEIPAYEFVGDMVIVG